jgi:hypothetical protein
MSDYLTNLAARSLESTPAIQPRLTSLFEPVRGLNLALPETGLIAERLAGFEDADPVDVAPDRRVNTLLIEPPASSRQAAESSPGEARTQHISEPKQRLAGFDQVTVDDVVPDRRSNNFPIEPPASSRPTTQSGEVNDARPENIGERSPRLSEPERPATSPAIKPTLQTLPLPERKPDETGNPESNVAHAAPSPEKPGAPIVVPVIAFSSVHERADREVETSAEGARRALAEIDIPASGKTRETSQPALKPQQHKPIEPVISEARNEPRPDNKPKAIAPLDQVQQERHPTSRVVVPRVVIEPPRAQQNQPPAALVRNPPSPAVSKVTKSSTSPNDLPMGSRARRSADLDTQPVRADEAVEQVINVTIGRVEIRAELPTTTRQKVRSSKPSSSLMSLDDYLRQRAQGGKR